LVEGIEALLEPLGDDTGVIRSYADANVEVDHPLYGYEDAFHRQTKAGNERRGVYAVLAAPPVIRLNWRDETRFRDQTQRNPEACALRDPWCAGAARHGTGAPGLRDHLAEHRQSRRLRLPHPGDPAPGTGAES